MVVIYSIENWKMGTKNTPLDVLIESMVCQSDDNLYTPLIYKLRYTNIAYKNFDSFSRSYFYRLSNLAKAISTQDAPMRLNENTDPFFQLLLLLCTLYSQISQLIRFLEKRSDEIMLDSLVGSEMFRNKSRFLYFRNKVEHWNDYITLIHPNLAMYRETETVVPYIGLLSTPDKSIKNYKKLLDIFSQYMSPDTIFLPNAPFYTSQFGDGSNESYIEFIYTNLENIDNRLGKKIPEEITRALFVYGFPLPTPNIHNLFEDFAQHFLTRSNRILS
mgnify:CR=1 FL=1